MSIPEILIWLIWLLPFAAFALTWIAGWISKKTPSSPFVIVATVASLALSVYAFLYVIQNQLPDYFKNLHMYMIDNSHGNELSRSKHILAGMKQLPKGSFDRFAQFCYYNYTRAQERRAPRTQKLLDAIEVHGKSDAVSDGFYETSRSLVKLTNLLTFNLRTIVLMICMLLHLELIGMLFVWLVLEPIRIVLLLKYEKLARNLLPLVK